MSCEGNFINYLHICITIILYLLYVDMDINTGIQYLYSDDDENHNTISPLLEIDICFDEKRWTTGQTKFILDEYAQKCKQVGPMKKFKNKKAMYGSISEAMKEKNWIKSAVQIENKIKSVLKQKKDAVVNNKKSGNTRKQVLFEEELDHIAAGDDSIDPDYLLSPTGSYAKDVSITSYASEPSTSASILQSSDELPNAVSKKKKSYQLRMLY